MKRLVLVCLLLYGCSFQAADPSADYGPYPNNYEKIVTAYMEESLIDPWSAQYKMSKPRRAYANDGLMFGGGVLWYGYVVDVAVNARNRYGGYTGWQYYQVPIQNGQVIREKRGIIRIVDK
jgi:hypothetical protein